MASKAASLERLGFVSEAQASWAALAHLWPQAASYAVSCIFIAIVWVNHHHLLSFTTSWVAKTGMGSVAVWAYAAVFAMVNASYILLCNELIDRPAAMATDLRRRMRMRSLVTLTAFSAGGLLALWQPLVGFGVICACLLTYLRPDAVPRLGAASRAE